MDMINLWRSARGARIAPLAAVLVLFLSACGGSSGSPSGVASAKFEAGPCPSRVASSPAFANAQCGQLIVPENRCQPRGTGKPGLGKHSGLWPDLRGVLQRMDPVSTSIPNPRRRPAWLSDLSD